MKRYALGTVLFFVLAGLVGVLAQACTSTGSNGAGTAAPQARPVHGAVKAGAPADLRSVAGGGGGGSAPSVSGGPGVAVLPPAALSHGEFVGPKVIETAQLSLTTPKGKFDEAYQRANEVAGRYQGYVQTSSSEGVNTKSGNLTIRVPSQFFQAALRELRGLGRVTGQSVSGQDVTSQYVDLQARLRNWQAQEKVLLKLMGRATTIGDTLRIQNELSQVQLRIEELKGQLRVLDNQTSFATIDVSMREAGHVVPPPPKEAQSGFAKAWHDAVDGFVGVLSAVVVGLGYLIPIAVLAGLIWLGVRRWRQRVPAA